MIRTLPNTRSYTLGYKLAICFYFALMFSPLIIVSVLAFNNSIFTSLPWEGFTLDWFIGDGPEKIGFFNDNRNISGVIVSFQTAIFVSLLTVAIGTMAAFLFEQEAFFGKKYLFFLFIAPLVVPGVILGISILSFTNSMSLFIEGIVGIENSTSNSLHMKLLSPGFWLVILGQSTYITPYVTLVVIARLKKFDRTLEEAAYNLGANRFEVIWNITLRFLSPALIAGGAVAFVLSFDKLKTTLFLVGSEPTMPITLFTQVRDGSTPVVNAISVLIVTAVCIVAIINLIYVNRKANRLGE
jgi:spermidine/putrescine transport system permease protein